MIIKKSEMKAKLKASFRNLYEYLANEKTHENIRNIGVWAPSNDYELEDIDMYIKDIEITQKTNTLSKDDKTYHLIISFAPNEKPDFETLKAIEKDIVKKMGYESHQRVTVAHDDTDNFHFHIAINKVNPQTFKIKTPYRDYKTLCEVATEVEKRYGLQLTNHERTENSYSKSKDIDINSFTESLNAYVKKIDLAEVKSWDELHEKLAENGVKYIKKGQGAVFTTADDRLGVKASAVDRQYSLNNLEKKFGTFNIGVQNSKKPIKKIYDKKTKLSEGLYSQFKVFYEDRKITIKQEKENIKKEIENQTDSNKNILKSDIGLLKNTMDIALLGEANAIERAIINNFFSGLIKDKQKNFRRAEAKNRKKIKEVYKNNPHIRFSDWIKNEAKTNPVAEELLKVQSKPHNSIKGDYNWFKKEAVAVTTRGTYILNKDIRFTGQYLNVTSTSDSKILANLKFYIEARNFKPLDISGSNEFKKAVVENVVKHNLLIKFADPELQQQLTTMQNDKYSILNQFNEEHNQKMFQYKTLDTKEQSEKTLYHGFMKHDQQFFIIIKSVDKNIFYVKEPTNNDYKIIKTIKKGDEVTFADDKKDSIIIESFIKQKEKEAYRYEKALTEKELKNATYKGIREYKGSQIKIYKKGNIFYSVLSDSKEQQKDKSKANTI